MIKEKWWISLKKVLCVTLFAVSIYLSGCSAVNNVIDKAKLYTEEQMLENADISNEQYDELKSNNWLDEDNNYIGPYKPDEDVALPAMADVPEKPIHVSFSKNSNLDISYYYNKEMTNKIDVSKCYLSPGESIYAVIDKQNKQNTDLYFFKSYRIIEYRGDERNDVSTDFAIDTDVDNFVCKIPENYDGRDIVIEPLGEFKNRIITLSDFIWAKNSDKYELVGEWTIADKKYNDGDSKPQSISIEPDLDYIVKYNYDKDKFYFHSSTPDAYRYSDDDGIVEFNRVEATDESKTSYEVHLIPYTNLLLNDEKKKILYASVNGEEQAVGEKQINLSRLKLSDKIIIETDKEYKVTGIETYNIMDNGNFRFTYDVPITEINNDEPITDFTLNIEKWNTKKIEVSVAEHINNGAENIRDKIVWGALDFFKNVGTDSEEKSMLTLNVNGVNSKTYTYYNDLRNGKKIEINEPDTVTVSVNKEAIGKLDKIVICGNDGKEHIVTYNSSEFTFTYDYSQIDNLNIEVYAE